jgi:hypothetical protein
MKDSPKCEHGVEREFDACFQCRIAGLEAEVERLRAALRDADTCVVCEAALVPYDGPLHCEDCIVTDDHYYAWQERRSTSAKNEP